MKQLLLITILAFVSPTVFAQDMDNEKLEKILYVVSDTLEGQKGNWQFTINSLPMLCVTDEKHNRMRIVTPIQKMKDVAYKELKACMEANFHTALDVKYAISDDLLWVVFIHPLKELQKDQVIDAISQVFNAALTYGESYNSTELVFPKSKKKKTY